MEAAMVAQQAVQQSTGAQQGQAAGNGIQQGGGTQSAGGGMFAALLEQMLGGNGQTALLGVGPQQKAMLMEQLRKQLGEQGTAQGMQMLAELIAVNPGMVQQVDTSELAELLGQASQTGTQGATGAQAMMQNLMMAQEAQQAATGGVAASTTGTAGMANLFAAQLATQEAVPGQSPLEQVLNTQAKQAGAAGGTAVDLNVLRQAVSQTVQTSAGTAQGGMAQDDGLTGQAQFQRALFQAQQTLTGKETETAELVGELGVSKEKKESEVKTDNVVPFPAQGKLEQVGHTKQLSELQTVDAKDLLQQVKTGLSEGIREGKNEFVIKLKPDGLGEITVRMLEDAGKITMSITTASAQTQRMLNNEIAALRDAVRPYNVEVQHVESQNTQHFDLNQQRQGFAQQQGQQNRQPQQQSQNWYPGYDYGEEPEPAAQEMLRYTANGLNTVV